MTVNIFGLSQRLILVMTQIANLKKKKLLLTAASSTYVCNFLQYKKLWKNWNHDQKLKSHNYDCISKAKALESLWLQRDSITIAITSKVLKKGSQNRDLDSNIKVF